MIKQRIRILIISLLLLMGTQVSYAVCNQKIEGMQKILDELRVAYQIPGIQVSISCTPKDTPVDFVSGTTMINGSVPVNATHLFQIGSETKSFIATMLLLLEADGLLTMDDPISKWLPQLPSAWQNISIRQLLNHTSGIFNFTSAKEFMAIEIRSNWKKHWWPAELVNFATNKPLYFPPGKGWHYSNTNYVIAGMIIQIVTGHSIEEQMRTRLLTPLQLNNTVYLPSFYSEDILQRIAHGYYVANVEPIDVVYDDMSWADAAGAMLSTSHDTAIWLRKLITQDSILPTKQRQALMDLVDVDNGEPLPKNSDKPGYGLGLVHDPASFAEESWWHAGGTRGYRAFMVWLACNDIVVTTIINDSEENADSYTLTKAIISYIQKSFGASHCNNKPIFKKSNLLNQIS